MSTAIWLAVLVGLWAVVLLPFVRDTRHSVAGLRSIDHFTSAMRVLSRRDDRDRRWVVLPPGSRAGKVGRPVGNNRAPRRQGPTPAKRRARTFAVLVASALLCSALAGMGSGMVWVVAAVFSWVALLGAMAWLRSSAKAAARARAERRRRTWAPAAPVAAAWSPATGPFPVVAPGAGALASLPRPSSAPEISQTLPVVPRPAARPAARRAVPVGTFRAEPPVLTPEELQDWADEVHAGVRVLDLTTPGGWRRRRLFESADEPVELGGPDEVPLRAFRAG